MKIVLLKDRKELGKASARRAAEGLSEAIAARGRANLVVATGTSQFETLACLARDERIDWPKVTGFHLDEYIGLSASHPASFRRYLRERFIEALPTALNAFHFVDGDAPDPQTQCQRLGNLIAAHPIDVACIGIGENGHLAFNDPPADFETEQPYIVVRLDDTCRRQQFGEGWFETADDVPAEAISMSIRQIIKSRLLVVSVPDARKAEAVRRAVEGELTNQCPASILRLHPNCDLMLDEGAASRLSAKWVVSPGPAISHSPA